MISYKGLRYKGYYDIKKFDCEFQYKTFLIQMLLFFISTKCKFLLLEEKQFEFYYVSKQFV